MRSPSGCAIPSPLTPLATCVRGFRRLKVEPFLSELTLESDEQSPRQRRVVPTLCRPSACARGECQVAHAGSLEDVSRETSPACIPLADHEGFLCPVMTPCGRVTACGVNTRRSLRPRACEGSTERGLEVEQSFPPQRACSRCNRCNRGLALSGHPLLAFGECEGQKPGRTGRIVWNRLPVKPLLLASMIVDGAVWRTVHVLLYV
jgi:hypothetical protein